MNYLDLISEALLIYIYRKNECLWNINSKLYKRTYITGTNQIQTSTIRVQMEITQPA